MSDIVDKLKNDPEFIKRVAESVSQNIVISYINQLNEKMNTVIRDVEEIRKGEERDNKIEQLAR
ncbi:hypothetical protein HA72_0953 [Metallosphaera sedula]|uniref:Uncharacterized protein n=2 Tax=Metallosphaera sedula TaxID=43687 RepID=A4YFC2_METS5|nr:MULTISPECIES: hypothetical protein [Metallosphaera]ABP95124.1 hypothetical protein Msed_0953 [Metallosphaera sedula DSM 5348]AIM27110.1 hypothetical protein HA72_0953 [Metallosphaera sedula]AKV74018.1 hypothetical protein MsedA_0968 [Metallosphaera sedula]AKV76257.1 hypothetical protein MsedB_0969 [Metallosphaera sedula]AKV78510.1 hypothetical protein MsedC_0968 [Metallosphaera sedula]